MARLVTLDVTNTCIRVAKSVGHHYVSGEKPTTKLLALHAQ